MNYIPRFEQNNCITLDNLNNGYIRVYDRTPTINSTVNYTDYFIHDNYLERTGTQQFGQYFNTPNCVSHNQFTTDFYYRIDFPNILIMLLIMSIFIIYIPLKIFSKLFKKGSL